MNFREIDIRLSLKEAKTIACLNHPNIIHIHDVFVENNSAYYIIEYIAGKSLGAVVRERGALAEAEAIKYIRAVAEALTCVTPLELKSISTTFT